MAVVVALFTRDLRVHDNPVLAAAAEAGDEVLPLFSLDPVALAAGAPNRRHALGTALADLRQRLQGLGADLVVREGRPHEVLADLAEQHDLGEVHLALDASGFAQRRVASIREALSSAGEGGAAVEVVEHNAHLLAEPGRVTTSGGGAYRVFTPYWRVWKDASRREVVDAPTSLRLPDGIDPGALPSPAELADGETSPDLPEVSETAGLARAEAWLADDAEDYDEVRDDLAADRTSRLSPHLHFGTVSARWLEDRCDRRKPGHDAFVQQLCWRDYSHQLLAENPSFTHEDFRGRGDDWHDDADALQAWKDGRTGYPIVDAAMRQLRQEGWMHNRARMTVASFLTKHLRVDWREGAAHFMHWLVDGDVANNFVSWQWTAGTGTDSRPNRVLNPIRQAERFDKRAAYIRRYVPELRDVGDDLLAREPWRAEGTLEQLDYPPRIVDHEEARERFLAERGA